MAAGGLRGWRWELWEEWDVCDPMLAPDKQQMATNKKPAPRFRRGLMVNG